jgi:hypothetical protein
MFPPVVYRKHLIRDSDTVWFMFYVYRFELSDRIWLVSILWHSDGFDSYLFILVCFFNDSHCVTWHTFFVCIIYLSDTWSLSLVFLLIINKNEGLGYYSHRLVHTVSPSLLSLSSSPPSLFSFPSLVFSTLCLRGTWCVFILKGLSDSIWMIVLVWHFCKKEKKGRKQAEWSGLGE